MEGARFADSGPAVLGLTRRATTVRPCTSCLKGSEDTHDLQMDERCPDDEPFHVRFFLQELVFAHFEFLPPPATR